MRRIATVLTLPLLVFLAGCGDSHEALMKDQIAVIRDLNAVLANVKDAETARAAKPEIEALGNRMKKLEDRAKALGEPSADQKKALEEKYQDEMMKEAMAMMGNMMKVGMNPEIQKELGDMDSIMPK
jgi:hypothetical protein